jgi:hypothetical protein
VPYGARRRILSEAKAAMLHAPDWITSTGMGSAAIGLLYNALRLSIALSKKVRSTLNLDLPKIVNFSGCTRSFLVVEDNDKMGEWPE